MFFDEIGDMPLALQVKLLRALQERECYPLGSNEPVAFDVRVLCATNKDLEAEVKDGRFREELLYRINVIKINLPPLRERKDDIALLANHFLRKYEKSLGRTAMRFSKGAMRLLMSYPWPGNVRELENTVERAAILAETDVIHAHDLPEKLRNTSRRRSQLENTGNDAGRTRARAYAARAGQGQRRQGQGRADPRHPSVDALPQGPALPARRNPRRPQEPARTA